MDGRRNNGGHPTRGGRPKGFGLTDIIQRHCHDFMNDLLKNEVVRKKAIQQVIEFSEFEKQKEHFVYVMESAKKIKIGYSSNIVKRIKNYKSHTPDLNILCIIKHKNAFELESKYHAMYDKKRINGEWFDLNQNEINKLLTDLNLECYGRKSK